MRITVYSTSWCGYCRRLLQRLTEAGIEAAIVDVDETTEFDQRIRAAAGGNRVVPTVEVGDMLLVNPSVDEIRAAMTKHV